MTGNVVTYRKLQSVDMDSLKNDLAASELCQKQPEDLSYLAPGGELMRFYVSITLLCAE